MNRNFYEAVTNYPIIAAVKDMNGLDKSLQLDLQVVFILFGDICSIGDIVEKVKKAGKIAMVHMDLISGFSAREITVDFIAGQTQADGIITTKQALIKRAKELNLYTVFRFFVIDSLSFDNIVKQQLQVKSDAVEILPGIMPKVIKKISEMTATPVIAGGLIADKSDVINALTAGAIGISATNPEVWKL